MIVMPRRSLVFVVSDFMTEPGWERPLAHIAQRHDVVAVRLFDPLELELPDLGLVPLPDLIPKDREVAKILLLVHRSLNYLLAAMVTIHVAAALKHQFVDRDGVLDRMLPGR